MANSIRHRVLKMRHRLFAAIFGCAMVSLVGQSEAAVTYSYVSPTYNQFDIVAPAGSGLSTANRVAISLTFARALAPNTTYVNDTPYVPPVPLLDWQISDGTVTENSSNAYLGYAFLSTDATGAVTKWAVASNFFEPTYNLSSFSACQPSFNACPYSTNYSLIWTFENGAQTFAGMGYTKDSGAWSVRNSNAVPEPMTLALLAVAGGALGLTRRR